MGERVDSMNPMTVTYQGGTYELVIGNVGSVELVDTDTVVQLLAESMAKGVEEVVANSEFIFAQGELPTEQVEAMFSGVDTLFLEATQIFDASQVGSLLAAIEEAGEALIAALA